MLESMVSSIPEKWLCSWRYCLFSMMAALSFAFRKSHKFSRFCGSVRALTTSRGSSQSFEDPELDWDFLLSPDNTAAIRSNCRTRNAEGCIDRVLELHEIHSKNPSKNNWRKLLTEALKIPNRTHPDSPVGDESQARIREMHVGKERISDALSAVEIGEKLAQLRTKHVSLGPGKRSYYFIGGLALLERALVQMALERLTSPEGPGFLQIGVPDVLPPELVERCGFPTRGQRTQVYHLDEEYSESGQCLAGTAEISLAGCFAGHHFSSADLPLRMCAVSRCYRREVPKQEELLYRTHQFTKVEMFGICGTGESEVLLEELVEFQTSFLRDLHLSFRVLEMPTEELGSPAFRKVDIEVEMASGFGEVSSASDCTDFQARRLHIRHGSGFAATVNGTALAVPRVAKAIMEQHQTENGHVKIPEVLWPWMEGNQTLRRQHPPVSMTYIARP